MSSVAWSGVAAVAVVAFLIGVSFGQWWGEPLVTAVEEPDEISDLVDWQLSKRSIIDNSMWTCHKCRCRWQSGPMSCPECGERKRT